MKAHPNDTSNRFVLEVFDRTLWCPVAQAPFYPTDLGPLRSILRLTADEDPELERLYYLEDDEIAAIVSAYDTFAPGRRRRCGDRDTAVSIARLHRSAVPRAHGLGASPAAGGSQEASALLGLLRVRRAIR